jgi:hypothetical protein
MTHGKRIGATIVAAAAILAMGLGAPGAAQARGFRGRIVIRPYVGFGFGPFWGPYWGSAWWGPWGGYWGPDGYPERGPSLGEAMIAGFGALDMNVKPKQAEVWVDGSYVAEAQHLDGSPTYLWLKKGEHQIQVYKGGYVTFHDKVNVRAGTLTKLKVRLEKGASSPPSEKAAPDA